MLDGIGITVRHCFCQEGRGYRILAEYMGEKGELSLKETVQKGMIRQLKIFSTYGFPGSVF
jgi:hypothetical protein